MLANLDSVARNAHRAAKLAAKPRQINDLDRWASKEYAGRTVKAVLANGQEITAKLTGISNQGFQGQVAHLTELGTGTSRQAPITKVWIAKDVTTDRAKFDAFGNPR